MAEIKQTRILLIDDNDAIHRDFRKVLLEETPDPEFENLKLHLFNDEQQTPRSTTPPPVNYLIDSAMQGETGYEMVKESLASNKRYSLAFIDVRMPPGWDGIFTIQRLWEIDPELQIVICSAYSDYSFEKIKETFKHHDGYLILKKPFDSMEIRQVAASLTKKWELIQQTKQQVQNLEHLVKERTQELTESLSLFKATLEATQEGIISIDLNFKINTYNQNMIALWDIEEDIIKQGNAKKLFKQLSTMTDDPSIFMQQMTHMKKQNTDFKNEWTLNSGKQLEVFIQPQYTENKLVGYVFSFRDITVKKQLEAELLHQATHDILTGLPNRALLYDRIAQAIAQTAKNPSGIGIVLLNIDNFKSVNDTLGYSSGDILLKAIGKKLNHYIRNSDTVTRFGGDEFVLVFPRIRLDDLMIKAQELLKLFKTPLPIGNKPLSITACIGVSMYPKDGDNAEMLLRNADYALYQAKSLGKNSYQFYTSEFSEYLLAHEKLKNDLQIALDENQFVVYYQPLINLTTKKISGVEALLRWNHPTRGFLYPIDFIDVIEASGLMPSIGAWVLKTACAQAKIWHDTINPNLAMAINISPSQFKKADFMAIVQKILLDTRINPSLLEFEITENLILDNSGEVVARMHELKKLGIKFSMDDFGTGYASLSYLKFFPFDKIKIDKSFVSGVMESRVDRSIIEAIIMMAKCIGLTVLAEGVTTIEELEFLKNQSTTECQGFYFSPAIDKDDCSELLRGELGI